jgi:hypothetical protein
MIIGHVVGSYMGFLLVVTTFDKSVEELRSSGLNRSKAHCIRGSGCEVPKRRFLVRSILR